MQWQKGGCAKQSLYRQKLSTNKTLAGKIVQSTIFHVEGRNLRALGFPKLSASAHSQIWAGRPKSAAAPKQTLTKGLGNTRVPAAQRRSLSEATMGTPNLQQHQSKHPRRDSAKPECLPRGAEASAKPHVEKPAVARRSGLKAAGRPGEAKAQASRIRHICCGHILRL